MRLRDLWQDFDWTLFGAILVLSAISLIEIYSATKNSQFEQYAALKQLIWICIGILLLFIVSALDYHIISEQIPLLYMAGIGVLVYTLALGRTVSGSRKLDRHWSDEASAFGTGEGDCYCCRGPLSVGIAECSLFESGANDQSRPDLRNSSRSRGHAAGPGNDDYVPSDSGNRASCAWNKATDVCDHADLFRAGIARCLAFSGPAPERSNHKFREPRTGSERAPDTR